MNTTQKIAFIIIGHYRTMGNSKVIESILNFQKKYKKYIFHNHLFVCFENKGEYVKNLNEPNGKTFEQVKKELNLCTINTYLYNNDKLDRMNKSTSLHKYIINEEEQIIPNVITNWAFNECEEAKVCNVLYPQFINICNAYKFVKKYEETHDLRYDFYVRTRPDLIIHSEFEFDFEQLKKCSPQASIPRFRNLKDGIADHIAFCNKNGAEIYFICEKSFRDSSNLKYRKNRFFVNEDVKNKTGFYDSSHNILHDHLLTYDCDIDILDVYVTSKPSSEMFYVLR